MPKPIRKSSSMKNKKGGCGMCVGGSSSRRNTRNRNSRRNKRGGDCGCGGSVPTTGGNDVITSITNIVPYNIEPAPLPIDSRNLNLIGGNKNSRINFSKLKNLALDQRRFESAPCKGVDSNLVGNSFKEFKPQGRFEFFNGIKMRRTIKNNKRTNKRHKQKGGYTGYPVNAVSSFGDTNMALGYYNLVANNVPIVPPNSTSQQYV